MRVCRDAAVSGQNFVYSPASQPEICYPWKRGNQLSGITIMNNVTDLLMNKGDEVWSIAPDSSVYDAIKLMAEKGIGALMVMEGPKVIGIISERDYARKVILMGHSSRETKIREIMSSPVVFARPDQSVEECMSLMTDKRIRHLPIMEGEQLVGVISIGDLVKSIIAEQQFTIEQLGRYISG